MRSIIILILSINVFAQNLTVTVDLKNSNIDDVDLVDNKGRIIPGSGSTKIKFKVSKKRLKNSSISAFSGGQYVGTVGKVQGGKLRFRLSGSPKDSNNNDLDKFTIKLKPRATGDSYVATKVKGKIFTSKGSVSISEITNLGLNAPSSQNFASATSGGAQDSDNDSVPDAYDVDADGDGIIDIADANLDADRDSGTALPFTTLFLNLNNTLNWHINGALDQNDIDAVIGGENLFSIAFFFNFPTDGPNADLATTITGGRVVCGEGLTYCDPTSAGTAVYSGFSEGDNSIKGSLWSDLTASGSPYSLENLQLGGGGVVWAGAVQPRVGTNQFRPGDSYRVDFLNASGNVVARRALTLPPYFVTVPALRAFNTTDNDASNDVLVDYSNTSGPGMNPGSAIAVPNVGGFSGKLRLNIWRLQRLSVQPLESGDYRDFGHLNYGVMINNNSGEYSCGELYEALSSTLTENPSQGTGGSFKSSDGALLWPLVDSADDYEPSSATDSTTIGNNTISLTVDLTACRIRNGLAPGNHQITITAAGADTGNGSNRAAQMLWVNIP